MKILVTGTAGFIGYHLVRKLLENDVDVVGLDNINDYYDVQLKYDRLADTGIDMPSDKPQPSGDNGGAGRFHYGRMVESSRYTNYRFVKMDLSDQAGITGLFEDENFDIVINLAAQAGVRYSLVNPQSYVESNMSGFLNVLEGCRYSGVDHLIYASSSSVYGTNTDMPFKTTDNVDHPVSIYAASKKSNELMAHTYSHLFGLPTTGLRFFTVYGPWGRPDMALFLFTKAILEDRPIDVYNFGEMERDFTYVDDIVEGVVRLIPRAPEAGSEFESRRSQLQQNRKGTANETGRDSHSRQTQQKVDSLENKAPYQLFNIGHGSPVKLMDFIDELERKLGVKAKKNMMEIQPGDVHRTWADVEDLFDVTGYRPRVSVDDGIRRFVEWYRSYYDVTA